MNPESVTTIADTKPDARAGSTETPPSSASWDDSSVFGFVIMAITGLIIMWQFDTPKAFLRDHWMAVAAVVSLATIGDRRASAL